MSSCASEETISIAADTEVAYVQSRAREFARAAGLGVREQWAVAIAASELATNVMKFGPPGRLTFRTSGGPSPHLEIEATDQGPGIVDPERAVRDGVTEGVDRTAPDAAHVGRRGLGLGLGAVQRLMGELTIRPGAEKGSIVTARMVLRRA